MSSVQAASHSLDLLYLTYVSSSEGKKKSIRVCKRKGGSVHSGNLLGHYMVKFYPLTADTDVHIEGKMEENMF